MTNFANGRTAEQAAAEYLVRDGYEILDQNWRTKACEIDIVAKKGSVVFFVEVKYRATLQQGSGLEYITASKQKQMQFAADMWVAHHNWQGECTLAALEVSGPAYEVTEFIDSLV